MFARKNCLSPLGKIENCKRFATVELRVWEKRQDDVNVCFIPFKVDRTVVFAPFSSTTSILWILEEIDR